MRVSFIYFSIISLILVGVGSYFWMPALWFLILLVPIILVGINDMIQPHQTIRRNFPVLGRMRYWMEMLRPKIYQYFIESDTDGTPYSRLNRNVIYQRAKKVNDTTPFGTQLNVYDVGYEWMNHSIIPLDPHKMDFNPRVLVGGPECKQPYNASLLIFRP